MGSFPNWFRAAPLVRTEAAVFAVGRRVYVSCAGDRPAEVALTDDSGADARTGLADGTEADILAWRSVRPACGLTTVGSREMDEGGAGT